ncbi:MAG: tryptophan synthase subunit alpha, partial [Planctomycetes bacterium]|nr:tryptophan synthase subunit alpha [Planctomycetota bacterium]
RSENRKALMPFITAGDPDLDFTAEVLKELVARGASMCEVGIPYSDPIADGPVIQASYTRALNKGIKLHDLLETLGQAAPQLTAPLVTMVSYAIIYRHGVEQYADALQQRGVAGMIVPDLPVEESPRLAKICQARDLSLIQLVTPLTPRDRALKIAETSSGFLYYVSVAGITGERTELPPELAERVGWLREQTPLPVCIGFGISKPEHVKMLAPVADGLIVGSAIVRRMANVKTGGRATTLQQIGDYLSELLVALHAGR